MGREILNKGLQCDLKAREYILVKGKNINCELAFFPLPGRAPCLTLVPRLLYVTQDPLKKNSEHIAVSISEDHTDGAECSDYETPGLSAPHPTPETESPSLDAEPSWDQLHPCAPRSSPRSTVHKQAIPRGTRILHMNQRKK